MEHRWNENDGKTEELGGKTCPSATLSTTNPTWTDPGSNPGLHGGRPAANRLSHGTALYTALQIIPTKNFCKEEISFKETNVHVCYFYILQIICLMMIS
jgi:hypothetical protein